MGVAVSPTTRAFRSATSPAHLAAGTIARHADARCQRRAGSTPFALDPAQLGSIVADRTDDEGREVVIVDASGELHIRLSSDLAARRPMILLPIDGGLSICGSMSHRASSAGCAASRRPSPARPATDAATQAPARPASPCLRHSRAWAVALATSPTEVARAREQAQLPSVEWKDSHARRTANRLIHDSIALVERGYLQASARRLISAIPAFSAHCPSIHSRLARDEFGQSSAHCRVKGDTTLPKIFVHPQRLNSPPP